MLRIITIVLFSLLPAVLSAQQVAVEPEKQVHWAAAAFFGTGWYKVDDNRSMFVFRIPPRQTVREAGWKADGSRGLGIEIHYPLALGLHQLDDIPDFIEFDNYGTVTFTPGVTVEIPVNQRWHLRPYAHYGIGYERKSGEWAQIYYGGIRSRYDLGQSTTTRWSLLNALSYAGYKPEFKNRGHYGTAQIGIEGSRKLNSVQVFGDPARINWHFTYDYLFDNLNFHVTEDEVVSIRDEWEIGLALAREGGRMKFWFISFEQVGLAFKWSSNGAYRAISFNVRSPFTQ